MLMEFITSKDFDTVHEKLKLIVKRRDQGMVVQAGVNYYRSCGNNLPLRTFKFFACHSVETYEQHF